METKIKKCDCEHAFQDHRYGRRMRVHTMSRDGSEARCTVCSKTKTVRSKMNKER